MLRVSVCLNAGPQKGHPQCSLIAPPSTEAILTAAANKLRLKKKEVGHARLFVWRTGYELPRNGQVEQGRVRNDERRDVEHHCSGQHLVSPFLSASPGGAPEALR